MTRPQPTVVWVDETHTVLRRGMVSCLTAADFEVLGESADLTPAPPLADLDVLVMEMTDAAVTVAAQGGWPSRLAVVATVRIPPPTTAGVGVLAHAGVRAFLDRDQVTPDALTAAVEQSAAGAVTLPSEAFEALVCSDQVRELSTAHSLATRERDVLRLLAEGHDTRSIGGTLSYSERTVKNIVHDVLIKLDCRTRAQAVGVATRHGWI